MSEHATATAHSIDSIIDELDRFHQRATYGAVAVLLKRAPRNLMQGRSRTLRDSWIVSGSTGLPTGYEPEQMDPEIRSRETILRSAADLAAWLEDPS
jgi:hypothetical protein